MTANTDNMDREEDIDREDFRRAQRERDLKDQEIEIIAKWAEEKGWKGWAHRVPLCDFLKDLVEKEAERAVREHIEGDIKVGETLLRRIAMIKHLTDDLAKAAGTIAKLEMQLREARSERQLERKASGDQKATYSNEMESLKILAERSYNDFRRGEEIIAAHEKRIAQLESEIEPLRSQSEKALRILQKVGLHPEVYDTVDRAALGVAETVKSLRKDLANPPHHLQCRVIDGLKEAWAALRDAGGGKHLEDAEGIEHEWVIWALKNPGLLNISHESEIIPKGSAPHIVKEWRECGFRTIEGRSVCFSRFDGYKVKPCR